MLENKATAQSILRFYSLPLLVIGGIIVNIVEFTLAGIVLACIAILIHHNYQFFREYQSLALPFVYTAIFLVLALPGFFSVIFISRLLGRNRALAAIVFAVTGALVWLGWAALLFSLWHDEPLTFKQWLILPGLISNAVGQVLAAILIGRRHRSRQTQ